MNYLAHFLLADPEHDLMVGNFLADGVRGSDLQRFPLGVQRGIRLHRFIDTYTDTHPSVKQASLLFRPTQGKYSPVVVDVLFDHVLARHWSHHHRLPLADFAEQCHGIIRSQADLLPTRSARFLEYMVRSDILKNYAHEHGIVRVFEGMDSRTRFASVMQNSIRELHPIRDEFERHFHDFFPQLVQAVHEWKATH